MEEEQYQSDRNESREQEQEQRNIVLQHNERTILDVVRRTEQTGQLDVFYFMSRLKQERQKLTDLESSSLLHNQTNQCKQRPTTQVVERKINSTQTGKYISFKHKCNTSCDDDATIWVQESDATRLGLIPGMTIKLF